MAVFISGGALKHLQSGASTMPMLAVPHATGEPVQLPFSAPNAETYASIYERQDAVRSIIGYLSRVSSTIKIHCHKRVSDTDRQRLADHPIARLLAKPNPWMSYGDYAEPAAVEYLIFGESYTLKVRSAAGRVAALVPLSPARLVTYGIDDAPTRYEFTHSDGRVDTIPAGDVIALREHNPSNPLRGLSRLESLRGTLQAEAAAVKERAHRFAHGSRVASVIERPLELEMSPEQMQDFMHGFERRFSGPENAGAVALLEPGMTLKAAVQTSTAQESQYVEVRKLTRSEVWGAFGMIDGIVASSADVVREILAPYFARWTAALQRSLLPEFGDTTGIYLEPNLEARLAGDLVRQADALRRLVGAPVMTRNEARARMNLPRVDDPDADRLVVPTYVNDADGEAHPDSGASDGGRRPDSMRRAEADVTVIRR